MVGSACFGLASVPAIAEVVPGQVLGVTYFVGSIFFTSAAFLVAVDAWPDRHRPGGAAAWWAAFIQLCGTVWFNINTFDAMDEALTTRQTNLLVWAPDMIGSVCFLVSSYVSWVACCGRPWCVRRHDTDWWIAALNLVGSAFFMAAAIAALTLPSTDELLDASLVNSGTLLGAVCFFWGARLMLVVPAPER